MDQKLVRETTTELELNLEIQTIQIPRKVQSNKKEYYNPSNHYSLRSGCYWRKRLPAQE